MKLLKLIIPSLTQHIITECLVCVVYYAKFWQMQNKQKQIHKTLSLFLRSLVGESVFICWFHKHWYLQRRYLPITLEGKHEDSHFTDGETAAQTDAAACPKSHGLDVENEDWAQSLWLFPLHVTREEGVVREPGPGCFTVRVLQAGVSFQKRQRSWPAR